MLLDLRSADTSRGNVRLVWCSTLLLATISFVEENEALDESAALI